ncbi:MAG: glycosyltransferase family 4 protein [Chroococcidiopsidaceae cyanobacterium CP_BM_ER_R8_30]|nr:glycosyltransferase family 4 protein [Chroococcidiopsidaceae cyanobacterium CP_BM_ER_R8_30]
MKILYLTTVLPSKRKSGGEIASQCFINAIKQGGHEVFVLGYQRKNDAFEKKHHEISAGERYIETGKAGFYAFFWMLLSLTKKLPYSSAKYFSGNYVIQTKKLLYSNSFDVVIIDHAQLSWLRSLIGNRAKTILIQHNIEHQVYLMLYNSVRNYILKLMYKREASLIKEMENKLTDNVEEVWTLTSNDYKYVSSVKERGKVRIFAVPSSLTTSSERLPNFKTCDIGIIGTWTWRPNQEGLKWFFQAVYPHLLADLSIQVAGKGAEWLHEMYPNVNYCGFVPSAQAFMEQAKVIAIPSISGGGVQIKTLDAIASGSPVVATPVALRGIPEYPCSVILAEAPEDFAKSLTHLLTLLTTQSFYQVGISWSQSRREKFFADVAEAINNFQTQKVLSVAAK